MITIEMELTDGTVAMMEAKQIKDIQDLPTGKKCVVEFVNGDQYTGIYQGLDGPDTIMLRPLMSGYTIGLPIRYLEYFLYEIKEDGT